MVGLIIVTHARIAVELLRAAESILGPLPQARALPIERTDNPDEVAQLVAEIVHEVDGDGDGVMILTDMFGGTPTNVCMTQLASARVEVVTAVNLPMILKFCSYRARMPLDDLASLLADSGRQAVQRVRELLQNPPERRDV